MQSAPTQCASQRLQPMPLLPIPMSPIPYYGDEFEFQALGEFMSEQPALWGPYKATPSTCASPPSVSQFSSVMTEGSHVNGLFHFQPIETFTDPLQYRDYREIKQEPLLPAPTIHPYYFMEKPSLQNPLPQCASPVAHKEKLRTRQRGYEKVYRKKKRVEFKHMRREWIQLEMKHRTLRERMRNRPATYLHKKTPSKAEMLLQLQLEERALRDDMVSLQSLKAWYEVSIVRLPVDKDGAILRTNHEWETVSDTLLGVSTTAPFAPLKLTFSW